VGKLWGCRMGVGDRQTETTHMELLFSMLGLIALGLLANRYGRDSRERIHSIEERQARSGLVWHALH
jgi:hypothetical protein